MCMYFVFMHFPVNIISRLFRHLNQHAHVYVLCLYALPWGEVVHPYKDGPCVVVGVLPSKWIHAIGTHTKHDVPWIFCSKSMYGIECSPLASICEVSQLRIISIVG